MNTEEALKRVDDDFAEWYRTLSAPIRLRIRKDALALAFDAGYLRGWRFRGEVEETDRRKGVMP